MEEACSKGCARGGKAGGRARGGAAGACVEEVQATALVRERAEEPSEERWKKKSEAEGVLE